METETVSGALCSADGAPVSQEADHGQIDTKRYDGEAPVRVCDSFD